MKGSHFVKKYSVQFVNAARQAVGAVLLRRTTSRTNARRPGRCVRSEFDQMMLDNAREHGVDVHEGVRVLEVLFEGDAGRRRARADGGRHGARGAGEGGRRRQRPERADR